jgi:uncharacterized membrane protein
MRLFWYWLRAQLWFGPALLTLGGVGLALALVEFDTVVDDARPKYGVGADGARGVLAAVAGSVVSIAGVAFSITVVALALAASQYSSRVLRNFLRDRTNQMVLGVLVGTFAYCLVVLRTIEGEASGRPFVPSTAVVGGVVLAFVAIGHFVYFIHHIATSIQASHIAAAVAGDTIAAVDALFPEALGCDEPEPELGAVPEAPWRTVPARRTGYLQHVDEDTLLAVARKHDRVLRMERGIGEFVIADTPLVSLAGVGDPGRDVADALARAVTISSHRTTEQDPAFGIRQLTDVALRALSPAVNDTTTAVMCVDWLSAVTLRLARRRMPAATRLDAGGVRVIARVPTFRDLVHGAFDPVRRNAGGNSTVLQRMLEALDLLLHEVTKAARRRVLLDEVDAIVETARRTIPVPDDRNDIEAIAARLQDRFETGDLVMGAEATLGSTSATGSARADRSDLG